MDVSKDLVDAVKKGLGGMKPSAGTQMSPYNIGIAVGYAIRNSKEWQELQANMVRVNASLNSLEDTVKKALGSDMLRELNMIRAGIEAQVKQIRDESAAQVAALQREAERLASVNGSW